MRTNNDLYPISEIIKRASDRGVVFGSGNPENRIRYYVRFGLLPHAKRKAFNGTPPGAAFKLDIIDRLVQIDRLSKKGKSVTEQKILLQNQTQVKKSSKQTDVQETKLVNQPQVKPNLIPRIAFGLTALVATLLLTSLLANQVQTNKKVLGTNTQKDNAFVKVAKAIISPLSYLNLGILKVVKNGDSLDPLGLTNISDYIQKDGDKLVFTNKIDADLVNTKTINGHQINNKENSFVTLNNDGDLVIPGEIKTEIDWQYIKNKPDLAGSVNLLAGSNITISKNSLTGAFTISSTSTSTTVTSTGSGGGSGTITAVVAGTGLTGGGSSGSVTLNIGTSVTQLGNTFNGVSQLVQLNGLGELPTLSGINLSNLNASNINSGSLGDTYVDDNITVSNYLPLSGATMAGNIDFNNNLALNIGDAGTDFTAGGGLNLASTLTIGGDTNLYRSTVNTLATDDALVVAGGVQAFSYFAWATNGNAISLGTSSQEGGDISVFADASNNKQFYLDADATAGTTGMYLMNGNFGIGKNNPGYHLDIADNIANGRGISVSQTATTGNVYGIYASATGAATSNYGIYSTASGATSNYAAYLDGYTAVTGWLAANGGYITTTSSTFNLVNDTATTVNFAGAATTINLGPTGSDPSTIVLSGGSGDTGCTINGSSGSLTCTGDITGGSTGNSGYWNRTGTILSPLNSNDLISLSTVPQGSSGLSITTANISGGTTNGELITLGTTATGTHNGLNISAGSASSGTLNGINIGTVSGAGTKNALNIGTGWNNLLYSTVFVVNGSGKVSVLAGQGLDTLSAGTLGVGVTTANQINIGTTGNAPITTGTGLLTAGGNLQVNGKVGIGTTTPNQLLTITSSSSPAIEIHDTNSSVSADPKNPASSTNYIDGGVAWSNTGNVYTSNNLYASVALDDLWASDMLVATNYGFSVPTDAVIKGVKVEFERSDGTGGYATNWVQLFKNGVPTGGAGGSGSMWTGTDTYETQGSSSDLWGASLTPSDINNSTFGVGIEALCYSGWGSCGVGTSGKIDHVRITVYYSVAWTIGADSSDSGKFKISGSSSLGTNNILSIDPNTSKISTSYTPVSGDINRDGFVDFKDLGFVESTNVYNCTSAQACWNTTYWVDNYGNPLKAKDADFDGDGAVSGLDLSVVVGSYAPWGNLASGVVNTSYDISSNVYVGYGTTNQLNLAVDNGSLCVDNDNTGCPASPVAGRIYSISATVLTDDLAENMQSEESLEAGDVVSVRSSQPGNGDTFVERSTNPYDSKIVGVVSSSPGIVLGGLKEQENDYPIALSGRVPVKVSTENGPIEFGDPLTSASTPGVAMKATTTGPTLGKALESYNGSGTGKILVLVNISWYTQPLTSTITSQDISNLHLTSLTTDSIILGENQIKIGSKGQIEIAGSINLIGDLTISNKLIAKSVETQDLTTGELKMTGDKTTGTAVIKAGDNSVTVNSSLVKTNSKIFTSLLKSAGGQSLFITSKNPGSDFTVELDQALPYDLNFDWWIVN